MCALLLAAVVLAAAPAAASAATPEAIFADYVQNGGSIAGDYAFEDLKAALTEVADDPFYAPFASAVDAKLDADYLGGSNGEAGGDLIGGADEGENALPVPQAPDRSGDPPWLLVGLTMLAGALVVTGAGSSIYRRARR